MTKWMGVIWDFHAMGAHFEKPLISIVKLFTHNTVHTFVALAFEFFIAPCRKRIARKHLQRLGAEEIDSRPFQVILVFSIHDAIK